MFSLTWPAATYTQIYWNKRKRLHNKRDQLPEDWFGTPTWPPFHCFGTSIWPPWRHVKTLYKEVLRITNGFLYPNNSTRKRISLQWANFASPLALHYIEVPLYLLTFYSMDEILWCYHSNETSGRTFTWYSIFLRISQTLFTIFYFCHH